MNSSERIGLKIPDTTWGGGSGPSKNGKILYRFKMPVTEYSQTARLFFLAGKQAYVFVRWMSVDENGLPVERFEQLAIGLHEHLGHDNEFNSTWTFATDMNSIEEGVLMQLVRDVGEGVTKKPKPFVLYAVAADDVEQFAQQGDDV